MDIIKVLALQNLEYLTIQYISTREIDGREIWVGTSEDVTAVFLSLQHLTSFELDDRALVARQHFERDMLADPNWHIGR